jgi:cell division protein FtsQ
VTAADPPEVAAAAVPPVIDPRIRDRRVAVLREQGRRRLRVLLVAVGVLCFLGIAWLVVQSPLLAVDTVAVQGATQEPATRILAVAGVHQGDATLFVDTAAVARRVESLPWVERAEVSRDLPNGVVIRVVERAPVAWVRRPAPGGSGAETFSLVDRTGRVLADAPAPPPGLTELVGLSRTPGPGGQVQPVRVAAALMALPAALRAQVGQLAVTDASALLVLARSPGGAEPAAGEVRLGALEQLGTKGAAALAVLDDLAARGERRSYVDVRVPEAPATG